MSNKIKLLPDHIANQIAAGEVIQRPASIVKELIENSIDAQSTEINLILKNAGKLLVQVIDNGIGMNPIDARMSFEKHATSKIENSEDLFKLQTMGFRGEALASIAAVSQVEMITKQAEASTATRILVKGSEVDKQEQVAGVQGTSMSVKNLFYNVPARLKFLKSDAVEMKHVTTEFIRIALAYPEIRFTVHHNGNQVYHLIPGTLKQRVVQVFGKKYETELVAIDESTNFVKIKGFIGKPALAKKRMGDQYFFVNQRFIKSGYLHHAIKTAYGELLLDKSNPFYVLFLEIDPEKIDVNVHPTKQEIKFEDERALYNILRVSVRHGLGHFAIAGPIDFDTGVEKDPLFQNLDTPKSSGFSGRSREERFDQAFSMKHFERSPSEDTDQAVVLATDWDQDKEVSRSQPFQINQKYIISSVKSGLLIIDYRRALERINFESILKQLDVQDQPGQMDMFPLTLHIQPREMATIKELEKDLEGMGFQLDYLSQQSIIIQAYPAWIKTDDIERFFLDLIEDFDNSDLVKNKSRERMAQSIATMDARHQKITLDVSTMRGIIDQLFACEMPQVTPDGRRCFAIIDVDELSSRIEKEGL